MDSDGRREWPNFCDSAIETLSRQWKRLSRDRMMGRLALTIPRQASTVDHKMPSTSVPGSKLIGYISLVMIIEWGHTSWITRLAP